MSFINDANDTFNNHLALTDVNVYFVPRRLDFNITNMSVDKKIPDARVLVHKEETVSVSLDLSGPALHQRGYRDETGEAPLKENLAAAVLARSGWQNEPLLDPMCGSGTLLIEATMQACDMAPGLLRRRFGFEKWLQHQPEIWQTLFAEASVRAKRGHKEALQQPERFVGFDLDAAYCSVRKRMLTARVWVI